MTLSSDPVYSGQTGGESAAEWRRPPAAGRSELPLQIAVFGVLALAAIAFRDLLEFASMRELADPSITGAERLFFVPSDSSPELIFPGFVWMLWNRRRSLRASLARPGSPWIALPVLALAVVLTVWSYHVRQPPLLLVGMATMLLGGGWLLGGATAAKILLIPAVFLQFAWPLPGVLVNHVVYPLQLAAGQIATAMLTVLGMTWSRAGDLILAEGKLFQVIETCSGLRGITTLLMTAFLYSELFHRSARRLVWLVAGAILIAFLVNGVRVLTIILNPYAQISEVHTAQGLVAIVVGVLGIAAFDALLDRIPAERKRGEARRRLPRVARAPLFAWRWAVLVAALLGSIVLADLVGSWQPASEPRVRLKSRVPLELAGWTAEVKAIDEQFLGSVRYSDSVSRVYRDGEQWVSVLVLEDNRIHQLLSIDSPKTAVGWTGWDVTKRRPIELDDGRKGELLRLRSLRGEEQLVLHWQSGLAPLPVEILRSVLSLDRSPLRRSDPARAVRFATSLGSHPDAESQAERRLLAFAALLVPALDSDAPG